MGLENLEEELKNHYIWLHRHPELALAEIQTTDYIKKVLSQIEGVEVLELGLPTGALAKIQGKAETPQILLRADIDALPITEESEVPYTSENRGCMHACGHDFHTASMLGTAKLLAKRREQLQGTIFILFQPAEEAEHGGDRVVETGLFDKYPIQEAFGLHVKNGLPVGTIEIAPGPFSAAVDRFAITVKGIGAHGSAPEKALDPISAAARLVGSLQEIVSRKVQPGNPAVVSVTRFTSGTSWNIIPEIAELEGTVRSFDKEVRELIVSEMERRSNALKEEGYKVRFDWLPGCPATNNDEKLSELVAVTAKENGFTVVPQKPEMGGEDFSCYQELVPGAFFHVGTGDGAPAHNAKFKLDLDALAPASRLMARVAEAALDRLTEE